MKNLFPFYLLLVFLLSSCDIDVSIPPQTLPITTTPPSIIENFTPEVLTVNSSVEGQVQDVNKNPIPDAMVQLGNLSTLTNEYGLFSFENVSMNEKGTLITVSKDGLINGSRRFFPREGSSSRVIIELIPANISATFDASTGCLLYTSPSPRD